MSSGDTRGSQKPVRFEISDVRTYKRPDLAVLLWLDLVTMPGGRMVDMVRSVEQYANTGAAGVYYDPSWSDDREAWRESAREPAEITAGDLLDRLAADKPELRQVLAVTSYAVTVSLDSDACKKRVCSAPVA